MSDLRDASNGRNVCAKSANTKDPVSRLRVRSTYNTVYNRRAVHSMQLQILYLSEICLAEHVKT